MNQPLQHLEPTALSYTCPRFAVVGDPVTGKLRRISQFCGRHNCSTCGPKNKARWHDHLMAKFQAGGSTMIHYYRIRKEHWKKAYRQIHQLDAEFVRIPRPTFGPGGHDQVVFTTVLLTGFRSPENRSFGSSDPVELSALSSLLEKTLFEMPKDVKHPVHVSEGFKLHLPKETTKGYIWLGFSHATTHESDLGAASQRSSVHHIGDQGQDRLYDDHYPGMIEEELGLLTLLMYLGVTSPVIKNVRRFLSIRREFSTEFAAA